MPTRLLALSVQLGKEQGQGTELHFPRAIERSGHCLMCESGKCLALPRPINQLWHCCMCLHVCCSIPQRETGAQLICARKINSLAHVVDIRPQRCNYEKGMPSQNQLHTNASPHTEFLHTASLPALGCKAIRLSGSLLRRMFLPALYVNPTLVWPTTGPQGSHKKCDRQSGRERPALILPSGSLQKAC